MTTTKTTTSVTLSEIEAVEVVGALADLSRIISVLGTDPTLAQHLADLGNIIQARLNA